MSCALMAYNKDRDVYNEICKGSKEDCLKKGNEIQPKLGTLGFVDETGEPYDWLEIWDEEDDNGIDDIIIY